MLQQHAAVRSVCVGCVSQKMASQMKQDLKTGEKIYRHPVPAWRHGTKVVFRVAIADENSEREELRELKPYVDPNSPIFID